MAKQLYDYWFVQFDFPNEEGKPYKSSGGKMVWNDKLKREIPAIFKAGFLGELSSFRNGINYAKDEIGEQFEIINVRNISSSKILLDGESFDTISVPASRAGNYIVKDNDIIIARSGCPGSTRLLLSLSNILFCGFIICCTPNEPVMRNYLTYCLKQLEGTSATISGGSILQNVSQETLKSLCVAQPTIDVLEKFNDTISSLFARMLNCLTENKMLIKQRDELLPLLMNGQVSVNYHLAKKNNVVNTLFRAKLLTLYKIGLNMSENLKLWDIIDSFISGDWGNEEESPEAPCCVSCIRGADIVPICNSDFDNIPIRYISNRSFTTHCLQEGDIIVEKSGGSPTQSTGRVVYISKELLAAKHDIVCSNFCVAFRVKPEWNSLYIYYYLRNVYNAGVFFNFEGKTSGIKNLDIETAFKAIPIKTIAMETQISIATAISCLDKKIVLNRALNDNLPTPDRSSAEAVIRLVA